MPINHTLNNVVGMLWTNFFPEATGKITRNFGWKYLSNSLTAFKNHTMYQMCFLHPPESNNVLKWRTAPKRYCWPTVLQLSVHTKYADWDKYLNMHMLFVSNWEYTPCLFCWSWIFTPHLVKNQLHLGNRWQRRFCQDLHSFTCIMTLSIDNFCRIFSSKPKRNCFKGISFTSKFHIQIKGQGWVLGKSNLTPKSFYCFWTKLYSPLNQIFLDLHVPLRNVFYPEKGLLLIDWPPIWYNLLEAVDIFAYFLFNL